MGINDLDLRHLRSLTVLAEELNFGRAAERLHMSQPPLTRLVAEVERGLGAKVFERTTRRVRLTPVGEVLVAEARAVLARVDEALQNVEAAVRREAGQLRLVYTPLAFLTVLPRLLAEFRRRHHDVRIDLLEMAHGAQWEALLSGRADVAFADEPVPGSAFHSRRLHREELCAVVPEGHPLAGRAAVGLADLAEETFVLHPRAEYPRYYDRVLSACAEAGFTPKVHHRQAHQNCLAQVTAGAGVLLAPAAQERYQGAGVVCLPLSPPGAVYDEVWAAWPAAGASPAARDLIEIAAVGED